MRTIFLDNISMYTEKKDKIRKCDAEKEAYRIFVQKVMNSKKHRTRTVHL